MFYLQPFTLINVQSAPWYFFEALQLPNSYQTDENCLSCQQKNNIIGVQSFQMKQESLPKVNKQQSETSSNKNIPVKTSHINNKKSHKNKRDVDFNPNVTQSKRRRRTPQNEDRNIVPNIMHQIISFIRKKDKSSHIVQKIIQRRGISQTCSVNNFYSFQRLIREKWNHYVNAESLTILKQVHLQLTQIFSQQQQMQYNKISLMLVYYFLTKQFQICVLTSKRMFSEKKLDHLKTKRIILEQISKVFNSNG